jgi:hypothetical protein
VETGQKRATVRDGELCSLDGERLGLHLRSLGSVGEETPLAYETGGTFDKTPLTAIFADHGTIPLVSVKTASPF